MNMDGDTGFREIEHTADWELEVWAKDLPSLLEQAGRGMYLLAGFKLQAGPRVSRSFKLAVNDNESLLVDFLSELLWIAEHEGLAFDAYDLSIDINWLNAKLDGAPITCFSKEIKAVTYHNLNIINSGDGLQVRIVFDV